MSIPEEERKIDPYLGYPRSYAKLCRNANAWLQLQGYSLPFGDGPPKRFLPYAARPDDIAKLEQLQDLFPVVFGSFKDSAALHKYKDVLWQQLDHLGNAGFDPASFRVDAYGNVLYWHADPASPLAWEVCHWFPYSRGGKTVLSNLRIVQWQVKLRRRDKLEFLVPWWDLQLGVSINQFLSVFESTNVVYRQRCFSYFFLGGEDEMPDGKHVVSSHRWTQHFLEKQSRFGLAAAAIVGVQKDGTEDVLKPVLANSMQSLSPGTPNRQVWSIEEEQALLRGYQKFGFGRWKEIKDSERVLSNRSLLQIRDKYRSLVGLEKENHSSALLPLEKSPSRENSPSGTSSQILSSLKRECKIKMLREEERHMREGEFGKLKESLAAVRVQNEKEKAALDSLEAELRKHKKQVEKQRQWNETQAAYRLCLERMIQETLHQSVVYKEEARLNQVACNSLVAQLESQAAACNAAESQHLKHSKQRENLLQLTRSPPLLEPGSAKEHVRLLGPPKEAKGSDARVSPSSKREVLSSCINTIRSKVPNSGENRPVLPPKNFPDCGAESLSESEEHHVHKRLKKSSAATPHKRYHSAPRQRPGKENSRAQINGPTSVRKVLKREVQGLDKLYYEGSKKLTRKVAEEESDSEKDTVSRTFKLMPVIKRDENQRDEKSVDSGYASCGSQRFKGKELILHAARSRESSERFELDVAAVQSRVTGASPQVSTSSDSMRLQVKDVSEEGVAEEDGGDKDDEKGKSTLDKWLQMLLEPSPESESGTAARGWPEGVAVPPVSGSVRGYSMTPDSQATTTQLPAQLQQKNNSKKSSSDKLKVPFSGLFRKLSLRQHPRTEEVAVEPPRRQVTFEDWEGLTTKLAAMNLESGEQGNKNSSRSVDAGSLRSNSLRASTGSLPKTSSFAALEPHPTKVTKSVLYYSTQGGKSSGKQSLASIKAQSRRASINECAETWKRRVNREVEA